MCSYCLSIDDITKSVTDVNNLVAYIGIYLIRSTIIGDIIKYFMYQEIIGDEVIGDIIKSLLTSAKSEGFKRLALHAVSV